MLDRRTSRWLSPMAVSRDRAALAMVCAFAAALGGTALAIAGDGLARVIWAVFTVVFLSHGYANAHPSRRRDAR